MVDADFSHLPLEILAIIFNYLPAKTIITRCGAVCRQWRAAASSCSVLHDFALPSHLFGDHKGLRKFVAEWPAITTLKSSDSENVQSVECISRLSCSARRIRSICLPNSAITDIDPTTHCRNLKILDVSGSLLWDLRPLSTVRSLECLYVSKTRVSDLNPLKTLRSLFLLDIGGTKVSDLEPLRHLKALEELRCGNTFVHCLGPLADLKSLRTLHVHCTYITDLSPLRNCTTLESLTLDNNKISSIESLANCEGLKFLSLFSTNVENIEPLSSCKVLETVILRGTRVSDLRPLLASKATLETIVIEGVQDVAIFLHFQKLSALHVRDCAISDLTPWERTTWLRGLQYLDLRGTTVESIDSLKYCNGLVSLSVSNTKIKTIAALLPSKKTLTTLYIANTEINDVDALSDFQHLRTLDLSNNKIDSIGVIARNGNELETLWLEHTTIADISPLHNCSRLHSLNLSNTEVEDISSLSSCQQLQTLCLNNTRISDIAPLAQLKNLEFVQLAYTQINTLGDLCGSAGCVKLLDASGTFVCSLSPLTGFKKLETLLLKGTPVTCVDPLYNCSALKSLSVKHTRVRDLSILPAACPRLTEIEASHHAISSISALAGCQCLQSLVIAGPQKFAFFFNFLCRMYIPLVNAEYLTWEVDDDSLLSRGLREFTTGFTMSVTVFTVFCVLCTWGSA
eukprot:Colp12_sorted_trinity150504_noHs@11968